eukprot:jgi/Ulvmu1/11010/UM007_0190.1
MGTMYIAETIRSIVFEDPAKNPDTFCMPSVVPHADQCAYIQSHIDLCGVGSGLIPYMEFYYCWLGNQRILSHLLLFSWIFGLLLMLMVVTQRFFCPALEVVSDFLRLPPNVAGATLLSLGNGAPDFFTQIAAVSQMDSSSIPIALGEPIGAGLFVSNVVLAFVVLVGGRGSPVEVEQRAFLRDVGFYCGATLLVTAIAADQRISLVEALLMLGYYGLFVTYIAVFERTPGGPESPSLGADVADPDSGAASHPLLLEGMLSVEAAPESDNGNGNGRDGGHPPPGLLARMQVPLHCLARLTMPEVATQGSSYYPRACAVLLPITAPIFVVLVKKLAFGSAPALNLDALIYGAVCSGFAAVITAALYPAGGRHTGVLTGVFTVMAFSMSVLWMNILSGEMVRAWKVLGFIHGASQRMLGVTVLAWINSAPDFISDVSLAHAGLPSMAVAATFASPLFTLLGGLGITFLVAVIIHGPQRFDPGLPLQVAIGFAIVSAFRHIALVPLLRWRLTRVAAAGMLLFYAIFQVVYLTLVVRERD